MPALLPFALSFGLNLFIKQSYIHICIYRYVYMYRDVKSVTMIFKLVYVIIETHTKRNKQTKKQYLLLR